MLRALGGKNIGKCRLRAHQHSLLPPLSKPRNARLVQKRVRGRVLERVLRNGLHPASILDFRPRLGNRCRKAVAQRQRVPHPILISSRQRRMVSPAAAVATTTFRVRFYSSSPQRRMVSHAERRRNAGLHRFLISSPDLGIDASFSLFTPSCVHRFLILSPDLGIDARISPFTPSCLHRFLISGPNLGIDASFLRLNPLSCIDS